jgi:hypothetical protein
MRDTESACCAICLQAHLPNQRWFLLTENRWTDQLRILRWNEKLAGHSEMYPACGVAHVQQLVVHWMTTGSLNYPFACGERRPAGSDSSISNNSEFQEELVTEGLEILGELAIDRSSMPRILVDSPQSLGSLLFALAEALASPEDANDASVERRKEGGVYALVDA